MLRRWALLGCLPVLAVGGLAMGRAPSFNWFRASGAEATADPLLEALLHDDQSEMAAEQKERAQAQKAPPPQPRGFPVPRVPPAADSPNPLLRIALLSQTPIRTVTIEGPVSCRRVDGQPLESHQLNPWLQRGQDPWFCQAIDTGRIALNGRPYPGLIEFQRQASGWSAVNVLDLETYVASVVGAEMPSSWRSEALKAQAVAARSYALVHLVRPASQDYNLGDTTRWQAYAGLSSTTNPSREATAATRGMVLSYRGGLVESLYAASSDISREAHGHLGASMSQTGAQQLATEGLRFNEILGRYYMGAALARLRSDG
jgi:stage II sporulation protein D